MYEVLSVFLPWLQKLPYGRDCFRDKDGRIDKKVFELYKTVYGLRKDNKIFKNYYDISLTVTRISGEKYIGDYIKNIDSLKLNLTVSVSLLASIVFIDGIVEGLYFWALCNGCILKLVKPIIDIEESVRQ